MLRKIWLDEQRALSCSEPRRVLQAARARLVERKTKIEGEPHIVARMPHPDLWLAGFRDSEGNVMALMSEVRR